MIIKDKDFEMIQVKDSTFFDLYFLTAVNAGKENERFEMKISGYGLPLESAIKAIVAHRMSEVDVEYSLTEFTQQYKDEVSKIHKLIS